MDNEPKFIQKVNLGFQNNFINSFGIIFLIIFVHFFSRFYLRNYYYSEIWDLSIYFLSISVGLVYFIRFYLNKNFHSKLFNILLIVSFIGFISGLLFIEDNGLWNNEYPISDYIWSGFGFRNLIFLVLISIFIFDLLNKKIFNKQKKIFLFVANTFIYFSLFTSFWQTSSSLIDVHHNEYVINDFLAIKAGNFPFETYIPQYQTLYSFLSLLYVGLEIDQFINVGLVTMFIASVITVLIAIHLVKKTLPSNSWMISSLIVIPLTLVSPFPNRRDVYGTIAAHLSAVSGRLFMCVLILFFFYKSFTSTQQEKKRNLILIFTGFLTGLNLWSNQDFSLSVILTMLTLIWIFSEKKYNSIILNYSFLVFGILFGISILPILYNLFNHDINFTYVGLITEAYLSGYGSKKMLPGPVFLIFPLLISLVVSHLYMFSRLKYIKSFEFKQMKQNSILGIIFGSWSVLGFVYYLNLSSTSIQLQIILLPLSVALGAFIGNLVLMDQNMNNLSVLNLLKEKRFYFNNKFYKSVFISLIIAFPFSTILSISNPINEFIRISESQNIPRWPTQTLNKNIENVLTANDYAEENNGKLVYFGYLGNYLSLKTGVQSGILFNNPKEILVGGLENREDISCSYLKEINPEYIVIDDLFDGFSSGNNIPYPLIDIGETGLCGEYFIFEINELQDGYFLKKFQNQS